MSRRTPLRKKCVTCSDDRGWSVADFGSRMFASAAKRSKCRRSDARSMSTTTMSCTITVAASLRDKDSARSVEGMILRDNVYGDIHEDAFRRDFTINALYYDPIDRTLVDYVGGLADLRARRLKLIGDPNVRFREDPVRILRAIRFATKLGFEIERDNRRRDSRRRLHDQRGCAGAIVRRTVQAAAAGPRDRRVGAAAALRTRRHTVSRSQHIDAKPRPHPQRDGRNRPARSRRQAGHARISDRGVAVGFVPRTSRRSTATRCRWSKRASPRAPKCCATRTKSPRSRGGSPSSCAKCGCCSRASRRHPATASDNWLPIRVFARRTTSCCCARASVKSSRSWRIGGRTIRPRTMSNAHR